MGTLLGLGAAYWLRIHAQVRRELAVWDAHARRIPDPLLRRQALAKLSGERLNPEAAALFAVLAPRGRRRLVVSLIVAYQVLYDFLDGVNEQPGFDELRDGLQLHRALTDAVLPEQPLSDYYRRHPDLNDGGYMQALCTRCRHIVGQIPSIGRCSTVIAAATDRCGQAQSQNHATTRLGNSCLIDWSLRQSTDHADYHWWELAAGGISCLNIHAVLATCADSRVSPTDAAGVESAYFPSVCSLSALLDSLADYHGDAGTGNHSFVAHYRDSDHAAERLARIADEAQSLVAGLHNQTRHAIILAGIVAYYLSSPSVWEGFPAPAAERLMDCVGALGASMCTVMRARRSSHQRTLQAPAHPRLKPIPAVPGWAARGTR